MIFYYDETPGHKSYLGVSNPADESVTVEIVVYGPDLATPVANSTSIPAGSDILFDPSAAGTATNGVIVVTPVDKDDFPVVPPAPLTGFFSIGNTEIGYAFGENPFGRLARDANGPAKPGTKVDGERVAYETLAPVAFMVPAFIKPDPQSGESVLVVIAFKDQYGDASHPPFRIAKLDPKPSLDATVCTSDRGPVATAAMTLDAITVQKLTDLAPQSSLTSSGNVYLSNPGGVANVLGLYSQSLGSFAFGQRLPAIEAVPSCVPLSTPTPTPTPPPPTPTPTCGNGKMESGEECDGDSKFTDATRPEDRITCRGQIGGRAPTSDGEDVCGGTRPTCNHCRVDASKCSCLCTKNSNCYVSIDCSDFADCKPRTPICEQPDQKADGQCITQVPQSDEERKRLCRSYCKNTD